MWRDALTLSLSQRERGLVTHPLSPDDPPFPEGLTWEEERERGPQFLLDQTGSRVDGKSMAGEIVTVYDLEDWTVLYNGVRKNIPPELRRCPPTWKVIETSFTATDGRLKCWAALKIARSSYGKRLCS